MCAVSRTLAVRGLKTAVDEVFKPVKLLTVGWVCGRPLLVGASLPVLGLFLRDSVVARGEEGSYSLFRAACEKRLQIVCLSHHGRLFTRPQSRA